MEFEFKKEICIKIIENESKKGKNLFGWESKVLFNFLFPVEFFSKEIQMHYNQHNYDVSAIFI